MKINNGTISSASLVLIPWNQDILVMWPMTWLWEVMSLYAFTGNKTHEKGTNSRLEHIYI